MARETVAVTAPTLAAWCRPPAIIKSCRQWASATTPPRLIRSPVTPSRDPPSGYQPHTAHGPRVRTDVVDVYIFRRTPAPEKKPNLPYQEDPGWPKPKSALMQTEFLQLLRADEPLKDTWHPVMGHVHDGESALQCALRELREELELLPRDPRILGLWALEQVHPFYISAINTIVMSPRFCCQVIPTFTPALNSEHSRFRWVSEREIDTMFMWPGQKACCREILREIIDDASLSRDALRVEIA